MNPILHMDEFRDYIEIRTRLLILTASALVFAELNENSEEADVNEKCEQEFHKLAQQLEEVMLRVRGNRGHVPIRWTDLRHLTAATLRFFLEKLEDIPDATK